MKTAPVREKAVATRDTVVYRVTYRDTMIYRYDTVRIKHFVHADTAWLPSPSAPGKAVPPAKNKRVINPNNFGIGPSIGAYYSPYNGFDVNIGFGIQYYLLSIPTIRKPHLGHKHRRWDDNVFQHPEMLKQLKRILLASLLFALLGSFFLQRFGRLFLCFLLFILRFRHSCNILLFNDNENISKGLLMFEI